MRISLYFFSFGQTESLAREYRAAVLCLSVVEMQLRKTTAEKGDGQRLLPVYGLFLLAFVFTLVASIAPANHAIHS